jgi:hypothetical protein
VDKPRKVALRRIPAATWLLGRTFARGIDRGHQGFEHAEQVSAEPLRLAVETFLQTAGLAHQVCQARGRQS